MENVAPIKKSQGKTSLFQLKQLIFNHKGFKAIGKGQLF